MQVPVGKLLSHMVRPLPLVSDDRIARGHLSTFSLSQLTMSLWALARLRLHSAALYSGASMHLMRCRAQLSDKALSELAATFTVPAVHAASAGSAAVLAMVADVTRVRVSRGRLIPDVLAEVLWNMWQLHLHSGDVATPAGLTLAQLLKAAGASRPERAGDGASELVPGPAGLLPEESLVVKGLELVPLDQQVLSIALELDKLEIQVCARISSLFCEQLVLRQGPISHVATLSLCFVRVVCANRVLRACMSI